MPEDKRIVNAVRVKLTDAEKAKNLLHTAGVLLPGYALEAKAGWFYLPLSKNPPAGFGLPPSSQFCRHAFKPLERQRSRRMKELLSGKLPPLLQPAIRQSYDIVGDIAVISIPPELESKRKEIARALLESNPRIKVVAAKTITKGKYRVRKVVSLAGEKRTQTTYRENGCVFKLDLNKDYFSTRLSFERKRVSGLARPGENVLVLFAGVGPYAIQLARSLKQAKKGGQVIAVEWNPHAAKLLEENAKTNHVQNFVKVIRADVNEVVARKEMSRWAKRIVMPILHTSISFIPIALKSAAPGCVMHAYGLVSTERDGNGADGMRQKEREITSLCKKAGRSCKITSSKFCGAYASRMRQAAFDVLVA